MKLLIKITLQKSGENKSPQAFSQALEAVAPPLFLCVFLPPCCSTGVLRSETVQLARRNSTLQEALSHPDKVKAKRGAEGNSQGRDGVLLWKVLIYSSMKILQVRVFLLMQADRCPKCSHDEYCREAPAGTVSSTVCMVSTRIHLPFWLLSYTRVLSIGNSHEQKCLAADWELDV